jgi:hypothetical protein
MTYVFLAALAVLGLALLYRAVIRGRIHKTRRYLRWIAGGAAALLGGFLLLRGRFELAGLAGAAAFSILKFGRLGPLTFESATLSDNNDSAVRSRYISMRLDHATGAVTGRVIYGEFQGWDLIDLGEAETRRLLAAIGNDADSLSLLETWLDKNRAGWREYLEANPEPGQGPDTAIDSDDMAYEVLGLKPGATAAEIRAAHRNLMKGVHPDQGGSTFLASKINEAKDRLLKTRRS